MTRRRPRKAIFLGALMALWAGFLAPVALAATDRGPVTNLPLPRYVSMKSSEGNVRRGPSLTHKVDWVFRHAHQPLKVVAEYGHWRRVQDHEGQGGWMHYSLLSGVRYVLVQEDKIPLMLKPNDAAATKAFAERGAVVRLGECTADWCWISAQGHGGWTLKSNLWGVDPGEIRE